MPIIVGIDGSSGDLVTERSIFGINIGEGRNKQYDLDFGMSFVSRICKPESPNKKYLRGPSQFGGGLMAAINQGTDFIINRMKVAKQPVLLTGYSRGAAGAICIAKNLWERERITVKALLLFDCVDRHMFIDAAVIPDNVDRVHHVFRDPESNSRNSFNNDGKLFAGLAKKYTEKAYFCTHGGMGGVPWQPDEGQARNSYIDEGLESSILTWSGRTNITYDQDERESKRIWSELKTFMFDQGFYTAG